MYQKSIVLDIKLSEITGKIEELTTGTPIGLTHYRTEL